MSQESDRLATAVFPYAFLLYCVQDYKKGEKLAVLPLCRHAYHARCITRWLRSRGDCPICRTHVKDDLGQAVHVH